MTTTTPDRERTRLNQKHLRLVRKVAEVYQELQFATPLAASNPDPSPGVRSMKWTPDSCHYLIDVSHAVRDAVANRPDAEELRAAWERIIEDSNTIRETETKLVNLLGSVFELRGLEPWKYFRRVRHGRSTR